MIYSHGAGINTFGNGTASQNIFQPMGWFSPSYKGHKVRDTASLLRGCNTGRNEWETKMQSCFFCKMEAMGNRGWETEGGTRGHGRAV